MISLVCEILKKWYKWIYLQKKIDSDTENKLMVTKRERVGGEINKESGNKIYALLYIK